MFKLIQATHQVNICYISITSYPSSLSWNWSLLPLVAFPLFLSLLPNSTGVIHLGTRTFGVVILEFVWDRRTCFFIELKSENSLRQLEHLIGFSISKTLSKILASAASSIKGPLSLQAEHIISWIRISQEHAQ